MTYPTWTADRAEELFRGEVERQQAELAAYLDVAEQKLREMCLAHDHSYVMRDLDRDDPSHRKGTAEALAITLQASKLPRARAVKIYNEIAIAKYGVGVPFLWSE